MDVSKIDINQLQAIIANIEQIIDQVDKFIPGTLGTEIRSVVQLVELIANNPVVLNFVLWVLSQLPVGASAQDVKKVIDGFDVNTVVA